MQKQQHKQRMLSSIFSWDGVRVVDSIVDQAELGWFNDAALLVDQILRDDRIRGALMTRIFGLLGKPMTFEPAKDNGRHRNVADEIEQIWPQMFPDSSLVELMTWGIVLGVGLAQLIWDGATPYLEPWHPSALEWNERANAYLLQTVDSKLTLTPQDYGYTDEQGGQWVLFTPYGYARPGRRGLLRNLARLYLERQWARRDRARYSEVHGQPIRFGTAPITASDKEIREYHDSISLSSGEAAVTGRQGEDGNRWDLKLVEATGKSHDGFAMAIAELDKAVGVLILGQSQSIDGQAGLGSNDQAGEPIRSDIMAADERAVSETLRAQVLQPYCKFTYGSADRAPYPCWEVQPPEDSSKKATELKTIADALNVFQQMGAPVDVRAVLEDYGVPMLTEAQQAKIDAQNMAEQQALLEVQAPKDGTADGANGVNGAANKTEKPQPAAS